jgi:hypothetical protein
LDRDPPATLVDPSSSPTLDPGRSTPGHGTDLRPRTWLLWFKPDGVDRLWPYVTAGKLGHDDPRVCPVDEEIASLTCRRVLVAVAGKDTFRYRGRQLASRVRLCRAPAWADDEDAVTLVESEGEDHCFHLHNPLRASSKILMESIVQFVKQPRLRVSPLPSALLPELHAYACQAGETTSMDYSATTRRYVDDTKGRSGKEHMTRNTCLQIGQGRPIMANRVSLSATVLGARVCRL